MKNDSKVSKRRRSSRFACGALGVAMVAVAGCGGGAGGGTSNAAAQSQAGSGAGSGSLGTLKIAGTAHYAVTELALPLAKSKGYFADKGLSIKGVSTENTAAALASSDIDVAIGSPGRLAAGLVKGLDVTVLGPTSDEFAESWIVAPSSGITSLKGLKGKKLGVSHFGSAGDLSAALLAKHFSWSKNDFKVVNLGGLKGLTAGLQNGSIDAFAWPPITTYQLQEQGHGKVLGSKFPNVAGALPVDVLAASQSAVKEHPKAVKAFCQAFYKGQKLLKSDPSSGVDVEVKDGDRTRGPALTKALKYSAPFLSTDSHMSDKMLQNIVESAKLTTKGADSLSVQLLKKHYKPCSSL